MNHTPAQQALQTLFAADSRKVFATLVRLVGDFDLAEEAVQEAFAAAAKQWETEGVPAKPVAWLISAGRFKAIDLLRKQGRLKESHHEIRQRQSTLALENQLRAETEIEDDRLRLIFTCCHPAIDPQIQVPLTLREVCGLTTEEIASAFLTSPTTMAQRIVRGKAKIREARIPISIPALEELPERIDAVLSVIYLVFNEGYSATQGSDVTRVDLTEESIRLARLVHELLPDPEVGGLLALMLLHESRRLARTNSDGEIVLLDDQDRRLWNRGLITEGVELVQHSLRTGRIGSYTLQAAIAAVHAQAASAAETDWNQIVMLYSVLLQANPSPVIELNRAVALAMRDGPLAGLQIIDDILARGDLSAYHLAYAAQGELMARSGDLTSARIAFQQALELAKQEPERRFLLKKLVDLENSTGNSLE
jgi:RNA polymerase sigma-70 factor (ECF subfamily)